MKSITGSFGILLVITIGCETPDERLVHQLAETSREVVAQHQEIAKTQHEIAAGSQHLVDAVAQSRREHDQLQRHLQQQRDRLESERRALAGERHRESLLVPVLETCGVLLVAALPLVLCWYLLHGLGGDADDVSEILVSELMRHAPQLLGSDDHPPALEQRHVFPDDETPPF